MSIKVDEKLRKYEIIKLFPNGESAKDYLCYSTDCKFTSFLGTADNYKNYLDYLKYKKYSPLDLLHGPSSDKYKRIIKGGRRHLPYHRQIVTLTFLDRLLSRRKELAKAIIEVIEGRDDNNFVFRNYRKFVSGVIESTVPDNTYSFMNPITKKLVLSIAEDLGDEIYNLETYNKQQYKEWRTGFKSKIWDEVVGDIEESILTGLIENPPSNENIKKKYLG